MYSFSMKGQQMITETVTTENYLEILDSLSAMETLELAYQIIEYHNDNYLKFQTQILEKPWKWSEYWVPALNGTLWDLSGDLTDRD